jgi:hypothetical protein
MRHIVFITATGDRASGGQFTAEPFFESYKVKYRFISGQYHEGSLNKYSLMHTAVTSDFTGEAGQSSVRRRFTPNKWLHDRLCKAKTSTGNEFDLSW